MLKKKEKIMKNKTIKLSVLTAILSMTALNANPTINKAHIKNTHEVEIKDNLIYSNKTNTLFSGIGVQYKLEENKCVRYIYQNIKMGVANGKWEKWSCEKEDLGKTPKLLAEGQMKDGLKSGFETRWNKNGDRVMEVYYGANSKIDTGYSVKKNIENVIYANGVKSGWTTVTEPGMQKNTHIKYIVTYDRGRFVSKK